MIVLALPITKYYKEFSKEAEVPSVLQMLPDDVICRDQSAKIFSRECMDREIGVFQTVLRRCWSV